MSDLALAFTILGRDRQAVSTFNRVADAAEKSGKRVKHAFHGVGAQVLAGLGIGSITAGITESVKAAGDYQASLTSLVTGAGESEKNLKLVGQGMLDLSSKVGASAVDLSRGMYLIESSGQHGAAGLQVLKAAAEGAQVGTADMATVADGLTTALNDYKIPASQAADVTSKLVATVAAGKTHMSDLAGALATVLPSAAAAHVGLTQVLGAMSTMTAAGTPAAVAATYLKQTIAQLENPTAKAALEMKSLGLNSVDVAKNLGKRGLTGTLTLLTDAIERHMGPAGTVLIEKLQKSAKSTTDFQKVLADLPPVQQTYVAALAAMVGGTKSMQAALQLTGANAVTFASNVKTIGAATTEAGGHVKGFALSQKDFNNQIDDLKAAVNKFEIQVGSRILPVLSKFIDGMQSGTGAGGRFVHVLKDLGTDAEQAWHAASPLFHYIGDHPKLFAEVAKDAAAFAVALKIIGTAKGLGGGRGKGGVAGGALGSVASKASPVPVFVTNPGFSLPGGKGTGGAPPVLGKGGTAPGEGRFSKILASSLTANAVLFADIALSAKAANSLKTVFSLHYDLSVKDAADKFLKQLEDPTLDKVTHQIMFRHSAAVWAGVAEAAKTGSTDALKKALNDAYADIATHSAQIKATIARQAAKDAATNVSLITGGLKAVETAAHATSTRLLSELSTGLGGGLGRAKERAQDLSDALKEFPELRLHAPHFKPEVDEAYKYLLKIPTRKDITIRANLLTTGQSLKIGTVHSDGTTLYIQSTKGKLALADGGWVRGPGTSRSDSIPALLSNREFVMNAKAAAKHGPELEAWNAGRETPATGYTHQGDIKVYNYGDRPLTAREIVYAQRTAVFLDGR